MRRIRESVAEDKVNEWYDATGLLRTKLNLQGRRGWPDQVYWVPGGRPLLIEYKADGEEPRKLQAFIHKQLRYYGYEVETHTSAEAVIESIKARLKKAGWRGTVTNNKGTKHEERS